MYDKDFSPDQTAAVDLIEKEKMVFLTGKAGSGKSYVVHYLRHKYGDKCAITATTGIAAQLVKGQTVHRFASIHPAMGAVNSKNADIRMGQCRLLIVDEISMASSILVNQIFDRMHMAGNEPRTVFVGDFLQLPPVEGAYAFESKHWPRFKVARLTCNHRQQDQDDFIGALNDLRIGQVTDKVRALVKERQVSRLPADCTLLYPLRYQVDQINEQKLNELPGKAMMCQWDWKFVGREEEEDWADKKKKKKKVEIKEPSDKDCRFPRELKLKIGARVVMLNNTDDWANGSTGVVRDIRSTGLTVELEVGKTVTVSETVETLHGPYGNPLYEIRQFPVMLAWGLTIHKAQGMSLDRVGIYLDKHFENSQTYVALSRCRTKEGLFLEGELSHIGVNKRALSMCGE